MRFENVCVEAVGYTLPPHVLTSDEIETRLAPVYERLNLPSGRLEMFTGIRERRYWDRGIKPGTISAQTAKQTLAHSGIAPAQIGCLIHGSVCRDQLEPATSCGVHHIAGLPNSAMVFDVSNACLGLLNGMLIVAQLIESGVIEAGLVVGTEMGYDLLTGTIDTLVNDPKTTRQDVKLAFASLTIGSGSAAIVLCHKRLSQTGHRLVGGVYGADTSHHKLCAGGVESEKFGDDRPRMETDSEALLLAGVGLAATTWKQFHQTIGWQNSDVTKAFTHQVGRAHKKLLYETLGLDARIDFPTVEFLGNTGAVALPMTAALGAERGHLNQGDRIAWLGIGSGLNSIMLALEW